MINLLYFFFFFFISFKSVSTEIELNNNKVTYINSKNIFFDNENNKVILGKDSYINNDEVTIVANGGHIDFKNNNIIIEDKFYILQVNEIFSGKNLKSDTKFINATADDVSYIINKDFKIQSSSLDKKQNQINLYNNYITPCKINGIFNCPTWSLSVKKTVYNQTTDKYNHYNTFLRIADVTMFYIPYFSHYGQKAPRKAGFLTPSFDILSINTGEFNVTAPYYLPLNEQADILFTPTIFTNSLDKFNLISQYNLVSSSGNTNIILNNQFDNTKTDGKTIYNSLGITDTTIINKESFIKTKLNFTNNISEYKDNSEETNPIIDNIFVSYNKYSTIYDKDYTEIKFNSITSFKVDDQSTTPNVLPSMKYYNFINNSFFGKKIFFKNKFILENIFRNTSLSGLPNNIVNFGMNNNFKSRKNMNSINFINSIDNIFRYNNINYFDGNDKEGERYFFSQILSSEINKLYSFKNRNIFEPKIKLTFTNDFRNRDINLNEDSKSISFDYNSIFTGNRMNGYDKSDDSLRLSYGLEYRNRDKYNFIDFVNVGQTYNFNNSNEYLDKIKDDGNFSDYLLDTNFSSNNLNFSNKLRADNKSYGIKEIFSQFRIDKEDQKISIFFNKTDDDSFEDSNESQNLGLSFSKKISDFANISYSSSFDVLNNYQPYSQRLGLNLFDDCSVLEIVYQNSRYNDLNNTKPKETISFRYTMEYLGFLSYNQNFNSIFTDMGEIGYGK